MLDQLAAAPAALDTVALLIIDEYTDRCRQAATAPPDPGQAAIDLTNTVRRNLRRR